MEIPVNLAKGASNLSALNHLPESAHPNPAFALRRDTAPSPLFRAVFLLALGNAVWFLWAHRFVPTADFPEWEYQGLILSRFIRGISPGAYSIKVYPVPHSITTVLGALLNLVFSPEFSGKIVLTIAVIAFATASTYLLKSVGVDERNPLLFVPLAFIFDSRFFWGELDYYLGFAAFCAFAGFILRRRDQPDRIRPWVVFLALCAVFEMHLVPYLCCGVVCLACAATRRDRTSLTKLLLPAIASGWLLVWYTVERLATPQGSRQPFRVPWTAHLLAQNITATFSVFHIFLPWCDYSSPLFKAAAFANIAVAVCMMSLWFLCALKWRLGWRGDEDVLLAVALVLFGCLAGGHAITGASMGERLLLPAIWLAIAWLAPRWNPRQSPAAQFVSAVLIGLIFVQSIYIDRYVGLVSVHLENTYARLAAAQTHQEFCTLYNADVAASWGPEHRQGLRRFLPNHPTAVRLPYYLAMERGQDAPLTLFDPGMLLNAGPEGNHGFCD